MIVRTKPDNLVQKLGMVRGRLAVASEHASRIEMYVTSKGILDGSTETKYVCYVHIQHHLVS